MYTEMHCNNEVFDAGSASEEVLLDTRETKSVGLEVIKLGLPAYIDHYSRGVQRHPQVVAHKGTYVVAWTDDVLPQCEIGGPDIRAKRLGPDAGTVVEAFKVNTETIDHQRDPAMVVLSNGSMVIAWQDFSGRGGDPCSGAIKAKIIDHQSGKVHDEFLVNMTTEGRQSKVSLAALCNGEFVAVWLCEGGGTTVLRAQRFSAEGERIGGEKTLCSHSAPLRAQVCALSEGGFAVLFRELPQQNGALYGYTKMFVSRSENNQTVETELQLSAHASAVGPLALAVSTNGSLIPMWIEASGQNDRGALMVVSVDADGMIEKPLVVVEMCDLRAHINLTRSDDGLFLVAMIETLGELRIVRMIAFDAARMLTRSDTVLHHTHAHCASPAVATLGDNEHMVVWEAGETTGQEDWIWIKAQRFRYA